MTGHMSTLGSQVKMRLFQAKFLLVLYLWQMQLTDFTFSIVKKYQTKSEFSFTYRQGLVTQEMYLPHEKIRRKNK